MIKANDPEIRSWIDVGRDSDFPLQNIPFGIITTELTGPRAATRIGDAAIDLYALAERNYLDGTGIRDIEVLRQPVLNDFIGLGRPVWRAVRDRLSDLFNAEHGELRDNEKATRAAIYPITAVRNLLPVRIGDYTDFYASIDHATNVGKMFRDPQNALLPNWKHLPVGYHGRSSSIVVSGTPVKRPKGQYKPADSEVPVFGPSKALDFELEMAFVVGKSTNMGDSVSIQQAEEHIFGLLLFNDLSARDIQSWEYVPLGPFLGKNFGSVASPWIVTLDALEPFRVAGPVQDIPVLPYLQQQGNNLFDVRLEVYLQPEGASGTKVCSSNFRHLYWSMAQQLAHHTINGCNINIGDLYASGTISGPDADSFGSLLELSWKGSKPLTLQGGIQRTYIEDNDTIIMKAYAEREGLRIGFGECTTRLLPAG